MPSKSSVKKKKSRSASEPEQSHEPEQSSAKQRKPPGPVMGLDLSMGGCGVSVIKGSKVLVLDRLRTVPVGTNGKAGLLPSGVFAGSEEERITWIMKQLRKIWRKHEVCFVVIEGHAFGAKGRALTILHELHGVVKHYVLKDDLAFVTEPPTRIKLYATGNGRADKQEMIAACNQAGMTEVKDSDRADAFWLGRYAWDEFSNLTQG